MPKRIIPAVLVIALLLQLFAVNAEPARPLLMLGFEPAENGRVWADNLFFERMARDTGIALTFEQIGDPAAYRARLDALKAGDDNLPDVLFKAELSPVQAGDLLDKGVLVDLAPLLEAHAPNLYAILEQDPAVRAAITLEGGRIPALPFIAETAGQNVLWINREWLDELKLGLPGDIEELGKVLQAFKERDPNRNGRADEVPLSFIGPYDLKYLAHAWGLLANDFNIFVQDGTVRFMPLEPGFRDFITWSRMAYEAGWMDRDAFVTLDTLRRQTEAKGSNRFGAFFGPLPTNTVPLEWSAQYIALPPLRFEGAQVYRQVAGRVTYGTFALTTACSDIPGMLAWVDRLYTPEGAILAGIGLAGEDYVIDGDGSWRLLRETGDSTYLARAVIATDQSVPGITNEAFQTLYTDSNVAALTAQLNAVADIAVLPYPDVPLTEKEAENIRPLQAALARYVDESIARFVLGEWPVSDGDFSAFNEELRRLGVDEFLAIWQTIYDKGIDDDDV